MSAKQFWTMTKGKVLEGVFGRYSPQHLGTNVLIVDSHQ